jgi:hypothetical protein
MKEIKTFCRTHESLLIYLDEMAILVSYEEIHWSLNKSRH